MSDNNIKFAIEALLFASEKPLPVEQLKSALGNIDAGLVRKAIDDLKSEYEKGERGVRITEIAGGYRMITATGFAPFLKKLFKDRSSERLSRQSLVTLAIIAYKQPLTRSEIELLRNVNVDGVITTLVEKNLIRICGRKKAPGRPCVYGTTRLFLEHFGLKSLEDLPKIDELNTPEIKKELEKIEAQDIEKTEEIDESSTIA